MTHWSRSGPLYPIPNLYSDSDPDSGQLELQPQPLLPPPSNLVPAASTSSSHSSHDLQSQSFAGNNNIQPDEALPVYNETASHNGQYSHYYNTYQQDQHVRVGNSHPILDSQFPAENELQPGSGSVAGSMTYNYLQQPASSWQPQPLASDIPLSDTAAFYSSQLSNSQEPVASQHQTLASDTPGSDTAASHSQEHTLPGGSHQPMSSGISAPMAAYMYQGFSSQNPTDGRQHQSSISVGPAPSIASHDNFNPHLQEHVDSSHPSLHPELQPESSTGNRFYQVGRYLHHSFSIADQHIPQELALSQPSSSTSGQHAPQVLALSRPSNSTPPEPFQSQAAQSSLGVPSPNDEDHHPSNPRKFFDRLGLSRHVDRRIAHRYNPITPSLSVPPQSSQSDTFLPVPSLTLDDVKKGASRRLKEYLFNQTLFPSQTKTDELAELALNDAAALHAEHAVAITAWQSRREGKSTLSQLKSHVKKLHVNSRGYAQGLVSAGYGLSIDISKDAADVIPSRQANASSLVSNYDFLDTFIQYLTANGQLRWFRVPFGNSTIMCMVEYMLVDQKFCSHVAFDTPGWESRLMNVIALAATICRWGVRRYLVNGWFGRDDLYTQESEEFHDNLKNRMTSLSGDDLILFRRVLNTIRSVLLSFPTH